MFDDLRYDRERVKVFSSEPINPGDCFYLGFADSLAGQVLRLDVTAAPHGVGIDARSARRWLGGVVGRVLGAVHRRRATPPAG